MSGQVFIDSQGRKHEPPKGTLVPTGKFRWKAGVLQELHGKTSGRLEYWIDVPTVADDAPDVTG